MNDIITIKNLKKSFGEIQAVRGIDLNVKRGTLFAFLGPNGAGKSTTIDMLCTLLKPDGGEVLIDGSRLGKEDNAIRKKIGIVFQDSILDPLLTVRENLATRARLYKNNKGDIKNAVLTAAQTADAEMFLDRPYGKLSGGQRRRADIARALVNTPEILFLDEPTTGLDPKTKESVWKTISQMQKKTGMTVFLTTHYMEEAAAADYITIINRGQIAAMGTPYDLKERFSSDRICIKPTDKEKTVKAITESGFSCKEKNGLLIVNIAQNVQAIPLLSKIENFIDSFEVVHGSMQDVFINITGGDGNNV